MKVRRFRCVIVMALLLGGCSPQRACWEVSPVSPVEVSAADIYEDGGTAFAIFADARGCEYRVCCDRRETDRGVARHLYIDATYPTDEGAQLLDPGSRMGQSIRGALVTWFEGRLTEKLSAQLFEHKTLVGLNELETRTARVLEVIRGFGEYEHPNRAASNIL